MARKDENLNTDRRCAIYTRTATTRKPSREFNSLQYQQATCEAHLENLESNGWATMIEIYEDEGYSAFNIERPALLELLSHIDVGKVDMIVVSNLDRITRSMVDLVTVVDHLRQKGVRLVGVKPDFDTTKTNGRLAPQAIMRCAEIERGMMNSAEQERSAKWRVISQKRPN